MTTPIVDRPLVAGTPAAVLHTQLEVLRQQGHTSDVLDIGANAVGLLHKYSTDVEEDAKRYRPEVLEGEKKVRAVPVLKEAQRVEALATAGDQVLAVGYESAWSRLNAPVKEVIEELRMQPVRSAIAAMSDEEQQNTILAAARIGDEFTLRAVLTQHPAPFNTKGWDDPLSKPLTVGNDLKGKTVRDGIQNILRERLSPQGDGAFRVHYLREIARSLRAAVGDRKDPIAEMAAGKGR